MPRPCNCNSPTCRLCYLANYSPRYQALWNIPFTHSNPPRQTSCAHLGPPTGETVSCNVCKGKVELKLFSCGVFGDCTLVKSVPGKACCNGRVENGVHQPCPGYAEAPAPSLGGQAEAEEIEAPLLMPKDSGAAMPGRKRMPIIWAYGVTAVRQRLEDGLLAATLLSLNRAGFDSPRLFVDGDKPSQVWEALGLEVTYRYPRVKTHGNWILALSELFIRQPEAHRYAIFQDDLVACRNLRAYLEACPYPSDDEKGYLNLFTFLCNQRRFPQEGKTGRQRFGWMPSDQRGKGAVALVFSRDAVLTLLTSPHMIERPLNISRGWRAVDGGIVTAMNKAGWKEYVHNPSLVQHTGHKSSMENHPHPPAPSFLGEEWDALSLLKQS